jgi:sugar lactone lactonase YvrE
MPREISAELLSAVSADVGEGPAWDEGSDCLVWVDIVAGTVHLTNEDGSPRSEFAVGRHVGAALPRDSGGWLLATREGFAVLDPSGRTEPLLDILGLDTSIRFNDGKCDAWGRAFAGTMAYDERPGVGSLFRLDNGPRAEEVISGVTISNGLGWSPDSSVLYYVDTGAPCVDAYEYDVETGSIGSKETLCTLPGGSGAPDGLTVDDDGCIWVALWGGAAVYRYSPAGLLDTVVRLPATQVTSCTFGGASGDILFITTARYRLEEHQLAREPLAGGLFAVRPGVSGAPAIPWVDVRSVRQEVTS